MAYEHGARRRARSASVDEPGSPWVLALKDLYAYYATLYFYLVTGGKYGDAGHFRKRLHAHVYVFSLALSMKMWSDKHYRSPTYQTDLLQNLQNVAIPGTGVPLSFFVRNRPFALTFLLILNPIICLLGAMFVRKGQSPKMASRFRHLLVEPDNWFALWQMNSRLIAWHSHVTQSRCYDVEDKWTFLTRAKRQKVSVTPWYAAPKLCLKHRNIEGGMGIEFYKNVTHGGDWIIQDALTNNAFMSDLLPESAPLSTFRIVTASRQTGAPGYKAMSCVLRAGRAGALTDHKAIFYNVDLKTGVIGVGSTNSHWYKLGRKGFMDFSWTSYPQYYTHPDTDLAVSGRRVPDFDDLVAVATHAHKKLCSEVPLVGWDVALTAEHGVCILEANLSCNFFCGELDKGNYLRFMDDCFGLMSDAKNGRVGGAHAQEEDDEEDRGE